MSNNLLWTECLFLFEAAIPQWGWIWTGASKEVLKVHRGQKHVFQFQGIPALLRRNIWRAHIEEGPWEGTMKRHSLQSRETAIIRNQISQALHLGLPTSRTLRNKKLPSFEPPVDGILLWEPRLSKPQFFHLLSVCVCVSTCWQLSFLLPHFLGFVFFLVYHFIYLFLLYYHFTWCLEGSKVNIAIVSSLSTSLGHSVQDTFSNVSGGCCEDIFRCD